MSLPARDCTALEINSTSQRRRSCWPHERRQHRFLPVKKANWEERVTFSYFHQNFMQYQRHANFSAASGHIDNELFHRDGMLSHEQEIRYNVRRAFLGCLYRQYSIWTRRSCMMQFQQWYVDYSWPDDEFHDNRLQELKRRILIISSSFGMFIRFVRSVITTMTKGNVYVSTHCVSGMNGTIRLRNNRLLCLRCPDCSTEPWWVQDLLFRQKIEAAIHVSVSENRYSPPAAWCSPPYLSSAPDDVSPCHR